MTLPTQVACGIAGGEVSLSEVENEMRMKLTHITVLMPIPGRAESRVSTWTPLSLGIGSFGAVPNGIVLKEEET